MLKIAEINALAKVAGVEVIVRQWSFNTWEARVGKSFTVSCVGLPARTKRRAMNNAWDKYINSVYKS